jgi:hypothetical protein
MNARMLALFSGGTSVALLVLFAIWKAQYCRAQKRRDADDLVRWEGEGGAPASVRYRTDTH